jgi:uncharacterized protein (TIGR00251 family)
VIDDDTSAGVPAVRIAVKVVPGARRDQIVGPLGARLKVRVSAPPEGGKANRAVCGLLAAALGVKASGASVIAGASSAEKTVRVVGCGAEAARRALGVNGGQ